MTTNLREKTINNIFGISTALPTPFLAAAPRTAVVAAAPAASTFFANPTTSFANPTTSFAKPTTSFAKPITSFAKPTTSFFGKMSLPSVPSFGKLSLPFSSRSQSSFSAPSGDKGSFFLNVLFYLFMYAFLIFLILVFIHFTVRPIFIFTPGAAGIITIAAANDNLVYWNRKAQPTASTIVPASGDKLDGSDFTKNFSFSIDLYIRKLKDTNPYTRLILHKSGKRTTPFPEPTFTRSQQNPTFTLDDFTAYMSTISSMFMYLTDTNDLVVTFFSGELYSSPPIKNVPLYTPFRISVITETKLFSVYLNNKLVFQRMFPSTITATPGQVFYSSPDWANRPTRTIFVQNFNLWNRVIAYTELLGAQPALALTADFNLPKDT